MSSFNTVAAGVYVLRYPVLDVNVSLVVGRRKALLVDTLSCASQAQFLAGEVAAVTALPVTVLNTHIHFDHTFGNATISRFLPVDQIWAHASVSHTMTRTPQQLRDEARQDCMDLAPDIASEVADTVLQAPTDNIADPVTFDLGGQVVTAWHPGPAHTRGDVVTRVGDVMIAGDLVEESGPVDVGPDSDLANWPRVLDSLLPRMTGPVVPGHGAIVNAAFVRRQRDALYKQIG